MKIWEAMLKGSKMKPQIFGKTYDGVGTCAMGAAYDGIGEPLDDRRKGIVSLFPQVMGIQNGICPVCQLTKDDRMEQKINWGLIPHLNDDHKWSRECIAYYIRDTFESEPIKVEEPKHEVLV